MSHGTRQNLLNLSGFITIWYLANSLIFWPGSSILKMRKTMPVSQGCEIYVSWCVKIPVYSISHMLNIQMSLLGLLSDLFFIFHYNLNLNYWNSTPSSRLTWNVIFLDPSSNKQDYNLCFFDLQQFSRLLIGYL